MFFPCSQSGCDKLFNCKKALKEHERTHNQDRPFKCDLCDQTFTQYSSLQKHARVHDKKKPYKCDNEGCNQAFSQVSNLIRHQRIHTGEKPYNCEMCGKQFASGSNLKQHLQIHDKQDSRNQFKCIFDACDKRYLYPSSLKKHYLVSHKEEYEKYLEEQKIETCGFHLKDQEQFSDDLKLNNFTQKEQTLESISQSQQDKQNSVSSNQKIKPRKLKELQKGQNEQVASSATNMNFFKIQKDSIDHEQKLIPQKRHQSPLKIEDPYSNMKRNKLNNQNGQAFIGACDQPNMPQSGLENSLKNDDPNNNYFLTQHLQINLFHNNSQTEKNQKSQRLITPQTQLPTKLQEQMKMNTHLIDTQHSQHSGFDLMYNNHNPLANFAQNRQIKEPLLNNPLGHSLYQDASLRYENPKYINFLNQLLEQSTQGCRPNAETGSIGEYLNIGAGGFGGGSPSPSQLRFPLNKAQNKMECGSNNSFQSISGFFKRPQPNSNNNQGSDQFGDNKQQQPQTSSQFKFKAMRVQDIHKPKPKSHFLNGALSDCKSLGDQQNSFKNLQQLGTSQPQKSKLHSYNGDLEDEEEEDGEYYDNQKRISIEQSIFQSNTAQEIEDINKVKPILPVLPPMQTQNFPSAFQVVKPSSRTTSAQYKSE